MVSCVRLWFLRLFTFLSIIGLIDEDLLAQKRTRVEQNRDALNFVLMGDWGRKGNKRQRQVADQMAKTSEDADVDFVIAAGDNFYPNGVPNEYDSSWKWSYEDVYKAPSLQIPWYPVLGNHDYSGNPEGQVRYSKLSERWKMPGRYYSRIFNIGVDSATKVLILFIDTSPLINSYYSKKSLAVQGQDSTAQLQWLENALSSAAQNVKWKFVVGHHPVLTAGARRNNDETFDIQRVLIPLFKRSGVSAYLSGHEHNLQHLSSSYGLEQFISGAASEAKKLALFSKRRFARSTCGFMLFSVLPDKTIVQVINKKGKVLYRYEMPSR